MLILRTNSTVCGGEMILRASKALRRCDTVSAKIIISVGCEHYLSNLHLVFCSKWYAGVALIFLLLSVTYCVGAIFSMLWDEFESVRSELRQTAVLRVLLCQICLKLYNWFDGALHPI